MQQTHVHVRPEASSLKLVRFGTEAINNESLEVGVAKQGRSYH